MNRLLAAICFSLVLIGFAQLVESQAAAPSASPPAAAPAASDPAATDEEESGDGDGDASPADPDPNSSSNTNGAVDQSQVKFITSLRPLFRLCMEAKGPPTPASFACRTCISKVQETVATTPFDNTNEEQKAAYTTSAIQCMSNSTIDAMNECMKKPDKTLDACIRDTFRAIRRANRPSFLPGRASGGKKSKRSPNGRRLLSAIEQAGAGEAAWLAALRGPEAQARIRALSAASAQYKVPIEKREAIPADPMGANVEGKIPPPPFNLGRDPSIEHLPVAKPMMSIDGKDLGINPGKFTQDIRNAKDVVVPDA